MNYRENFLKAMRKIAKLLDKDFPHPGVLDKDQKTPGEFVLSTPEIEEHLDDAEAAKQVIDNVDRAAKYLKRGSDHYAYPEGKRRELVEKYREAKKRGRVAQKELWVKTVAGVSVRTFLNWENEFPE